MISVEHLCFAYGKRNILNDVSFRVENGDFLTVLGPNGVGKSTLFRCVLGILKGYSGRILVDGQDIRDMPRRKMAGLMSYIPQNFGTAFAYSVLDTVLMGTTHEVGSFSSPKREQIRQAEDALRMLDIADMADRKYTELSGGEKQLVMIARALSQRSDLLLMDEPTSSLDYGNREKILLLLRKLSGQGYTVVLSTHDPQHALSYSDKVLALLDGKVEAYGQTDEVLTGALLQRLYGINAVIVEGPYGRLISHPKMQ